MSKTGHNRDSNHATAMHNEDEELRKRRIHREVIRIKTEEHDEELSDEEDAAEDAPDEIDGNNADNGEREEADDGKDEDEDNGEEGAKTAPQSGGSKSLWKHIVTGGFITSDGALQYYRYLIAIAIMCFVSIFLTFMSLNAGSEYRRKEKEVAVLRERSVIKSEERYRISSRDEVIRRLEERDMVMVDQNNSQRM